MRKKLRVTVEGRAYEVEVEELDSDGANISSRPVKRNTPALTKAQTQPERAPEQSAGTAGSVGTNAEGEKVCAPIPGKVLTVDVKVGDKVTAGEQLLILEAMKMENEIAATIDGEIKEILVTEGQAVQTGDVLVVIA